LRDRVLSLVGYLLAVPVSKSHTFSLIPSRIIGGYSAGYSDGWYQPKKMTDHDHPYKGLFIHPDMITDLNRGFLHQESGGVCVLSIAKHQVIH